MQLKKESNLQNANSRMTTKLAFCKSSGYLVAHTRLRCSVCIIPIYLFFFDIVCANALAATDFVFALVLPSRKMEDALLATDFEVCLHVCFAITITSFS